MAGRIEALHSSPSHSLKKETTSSLEIIKGLGVKGDAHMGAKIKHVYRVRKDPNEPNLRQVHIIHAELFDELKTKDFDISFGEMGENITCSGLDILSLPTDTELQMGVSTRLKVTGLRNPCAQLDSIKKGLMKACLDRNQSGEMIPKVGIMTIVLEGGIINQGDEIKVVFPPEPHRKLEAV